MHHPLTIKHLAQTEHILVLADRRVSQYVQLHKLKGNVQSGRAGHIESERIEWKLIDSCSPDVVVE